MHIQDAVFLSTKKLSVYLDRYRIVLVTTTEDPTITSIWYCMPDNTTRTVNIDMSIDDVVAKINKDN